MIPPFGYQHTDLIAFSHALKHTTVGDVVALLRNIGVASEDPSPYWWRLVALEAADRLERDDDQRRVGHPDH